MPGPQIRRFPTLSDAVDPNGELARGHRTTTERVSITDAAGNEQQAQITHHRKITKSAAEAVVRKERGHKRMYMLIDSDEVRTTHRVLTPTERRLLDTVLAETEPTSGECRLNVTDLARVAGIHVTHASKAMQTLLKRRYVERLRRNAFRVNPWYGYKGAFEEWAPLTAGVARPITTEQFVDEETGEVID